MNSRIDERSSQRSDEVTSKPIKVAIADDHPLILDGLVATLAAAPDIEVVAQVSDAAHAVLAFGESHPDVVLLDVTMPGGGLDAARQIIAADSGARVVMLTVSEDEDDVLAAMQAGARGYVLKGVSGRELVEIIRSVYRGSVYLQPGLAFGLLRERSKPPTRDRLAELTSREREVLALVARGLSNGEIGWHLGMAEKTVKHHMTSILAKLEVDSRVEAALLAYKAGIAAPDQDGEPG